MSHCVMYVCVLFWYLIVHLETLPWLEECLLSNEDTNLECKHIPFITSYNFILKHLKTMFILWVPNQHNYTTRNTRWYQSNWYMFVKHNCLNQLVYDVDILCDFKKRLHTLGLRFLKLGY